MKTRVLRAEQVADILHVHVLTVYDWLRSGRLPGVKIGAAHPGRWRVLESELFAFLRTREQPMPAGLPSPSQPMATAAARQAQPPPPGRPVRGRELLVSTAGTGGTIGTAVREHRLATGLTQREMAEEAGVSPVTAGRVERGEPVAVATAAKVAVALGKRVDEVFEPAGGKAE